MPTHPGLSFPDQVPTLVDAAADVTLRAHTEADLVGIAEQSVDPETIRWTTVPTPSGGYGVEDARQFVEVVVAAGWREGTSYGWAIEADRDGSPGYCGSLDLRLTGRDRPAGGTASVGFALHPAARGRSLMSSALRLAVGYGFDRLGLAAITWQAHVGNWGSRRAAAAAGFRFEGTQRLGLYERDRYLDGWQATITAADPRGSLLWSRQPELTAGELTLRPVREADLPRVVEACNDPETLRWLPRLPRPYRAADAETFLERTREGEAGGVEYTWAVADRRGTLLGCISAMPDPRLPQTEIGYWTHPDARGRAVMTAAVRTLAAWILARSGTPTIRVAVDNAASLRLAEKAGFERIGRVGTHLVFAVNS